MASTQILKLRLDCKKGPIREGGGVGEAFMGLIHFFLANTWNLQYKQCMMMWSRSSRIYSCLKNKRLMFIFADRHYEYLEEWHHKALLRYIR